MTRIILVLVLLAACVLGLGLYQGWFTVTVDSNKIRADENKVLKKVQGVVSPGTATAPATTTEKSPDESQNPR